MSYWKQLIFKYVVGVVAILTSVNLYAQHIESHKCAHAHALNKRLSTTDNDTKVDLLVNKAVQAQYDVQFYDISLEADRSTTFIKAKVVVHIERVATTLPEIVFALANTQRVSSVNINGKEVTWSQSGDWLSIVNPDPNDDTFEVSVSYSGTPSSTGFFDGGLFTDNAHGGVLWSLSEPHAMFQWLPCKQVLEDKIDKGCKVSVKTSSENLVASNGLLTSVIDHPETNQKTFVWESSYSMAYYLVSIAVAKYKEYAYEVALGDGKDMLFQNFYYGDLSLENIKEGIDVTADMLTYFGDLFGVYPFSKEKYGHAMAPMGGGMEHQTMTTQQSFNFTLTAHELVHQWWGNHVTCAQWNDIWINEGVASYGEFLAADQILGEEKGKKVFENMRNAAFFSDKSVYVPTGASDSRIFDYYTTYLKGAMIVHILRLIIHDDQAFFDALEKFQVDYAFKNATGEDLRVYLEKELSVDLALFFEHWYHGNGYPNYDILFGVDQKSLYLEVTQKGSMDTDWFYHRLPIKVERESKPDTIIYILLDNKKVSDTVLVGDDVLGITIDPEEEVLSRLNSIERIPVELQSDLDEYIPATVKIWPNPMSKEVTITFQQPFSGTIEVMSGQGTIVNTLNVENRINIPVDMRRFTAGMYFIRWSHVNTGKFFTKPVVKY